MFEIDDKTFVVKKNVSLSGLKLPSSMTTLHINVYHRNIEELFSLILSSPYLRRLICFSFHIKHLDRLYQVLRESQLTDWLISFCYDKKKSLDVLIPELNVCRKLDELKSVVIQQNVFFSLARPRVISRLGYTPLKRMPSELLRLLPNYLY